MARKKTVIVYIESDFETDNRKRGPTNSCQLLLPLKNLREVKNMIVRKIVKLPSEYDEVKYVWGEKNKISIKTKTI